MESRSNPDVWAAVDTYVEEVLLPDDPRLADAADAARQAGLPAISVSPSQGRMLELYARMQRAERILEVGTLGGYSTVWLARGLADGGRLLSLEVDPAHAEVARETLRRAGLADVAEVRLGNAVEALGHLVREGEAAYDLIFVDADKKSNVEYFRLALALSRPGTLIVVDNVVRGGTVVDPDTDAPDVVGTRALFDAVAAEPRARAVAVQTVGSKGYDGFALILVDA